MVPGRTRACSLSCGVFPCVTATNSPCLCATRGRGGTHTPSAGFGSRLGAVVMGFVNAQTQTWLCLAGLNSVGLEVGFLLFLSVESLLGIERNITDGSELSTVTNQNH